MKNRRLTAQERKLAIARAALPLFARQGFAQTTTKDLAKAAGVSEPLLYKHFPSKKALYLEIQALTCKGNDPTLQRLAELEPSTSSLVHLVYFLLRALLLGRPRGNIEWETRHRLMLQSFLGDGAFARLIFENRLGCFCARLEACLEAARAAGDVVDGPVSFKNRTLFAHHVGAWIAMVFLPRPPALNYRAPRRELLHQVAWFALRGMGLTDRALAAYYNPKALALFFGES